MIQTRLPRLRALWRRYIAWRSSATPPPAPDARPPLLKADVDPDLMNRQSRALSTEMSGGSGG